MNEPKSSYEALRADRKEWADLAYELWALVCNSVPFEPRTADEWNAQRDRLRDRFHAALAKFHEHRDTCVEVRALDPNIYVTGDETCSCQPFTHPCANGHCTDPEAHAEGAHDI